MGTSKQEKEIIQQMERDEQMQVFNDQINELKVKREEYARIAAEAEMNGDSSSYDVAVNALMELNEVVSSLIQAKTNFDIINISNTIAKNMSMAIGALSQMANSKAQALDIGKLQKANVKISSYMRKMKISQKAMSSTLKSANPANKARSADDIASVKPMIDAARSKLMGGTSLPNASGIDISAEIESEKNKLF